MQRDGYNLYLLSTYPLAAYSVGITKDQPASAQGEGWTTTTSTSYGRTGTSYIHRTGGWRRPTTSVQSPGSPGGFGVAGGTHDKIFRGLPRCTTSRHHRLSHSCQRYQVKQANTYILRQWVWHKCWLKCCTRGHYQLRKMSQKKIMTVYSWNVSVRSKENLVWLISKIGCQVFNSQLF